MNGHVSDLFFNLDHSGARRFENGKFSHFDQIAMDDQAKWFCESIAAIGGPICSPAEVIRDFYRRI